MIKVKVVKNQYARWAPDYEEDILERGYEAPNVLAEALTEHTNITNPTVTDAGIGTGLSAAAILDYFPGATIHGYDFSPEMLAECRKANIAKTLTKTDLETTWPNKDEVADIVFSTGSLEHIQDLAHFLSEAYRTLKPGGFLATTYMTWDRRHMQSVKTQQTTFKAFEGACKNQNFEIKVHFKKSALHNLNPGETITYGYLIGQKPETPSQQ